MVKGAVVFFSYSLFICLFEISIALGQIHKPERRSPNSTLNLEHANLTANARAGFCPFKFNMNCNFNDKFSNIDGSCNNLRTPWFGKEGTPYKRYMQPNYNDGFSSPRTRSVTGRELPNARVLSRLLFSDNFQTGNFYSHLLAHFGQFIAHDVASTSVSASNCPCNSGNSECMSIVMPSNENIMRMSCMRFARSSAAFPSFDCGFDHREQLNLMTPFIDLTTVYGPNSDRSRQLRLFQGGQLKTSPGVNGKPFLVQANDPSCTGTDFGRQCFAAGEGRTNMHMGLIGVQTLFLREHNRIASELSMINPHWSDERLFSESRKILIGITQHILYNEWLPLIIGSSNAAVFDLKPQPNSNQYFTGYDQNIDPQLAAEFATAAFRFGHTLANNQFGRFDSNNREMAPPVSLRESIFRPTEAYNSRAGGLESIVIGLVNEPSGKYDAKFVDTIQNHLFEFTFSDGSVQAIDLAATNINRGRDHGIPSYNTIREKCGFPRARSFQDLNDHIPPSEVQKLASVYQHVDDIDFYVGGLSENPANGAVLGPTFACIIANQFKDLKKGDRFYYENGPSPSAFTLDQLREIKKSTMSKLICNNFDLNEIQTNAFLLPLPFINNGRIPCSFVPQYDLTKWKNV